MVSEESDTQYWNIPAYNIAIALRELPYNSLDIWRAVYEQSQYDITSGTVDGIDYITAIDPQLTGGTKAHWTIFNSGYGSYAVFTSIEPSKTAIYKKLIQTMRDGLATPVPASTPTPTPITTPTQQFRCRQRRPPRRPPRLRRQVTSEIDS